MSESPATAKQPTEVRPKVDPTWRGHDKVGWQLHMEGAELGSLRQCAASVYANNRWSVWPHINDCGATYGGRGGDATGTDEAKAACVKALREAGCAFVGDPEPAAKPEPKGRIVRRWVRENGSHVLLRETGLTAGRVDSRHIEAWQEGPPTVNRMFRRSPRGVLTLDEAKALAEQWLTEAGYEIVDPPAELAVEPAPALPRLIERWDSEPGSLVLRYDMRPAVVAARVELADDGQVCRVGVQRHCPAQSLLDLMYESRSPGGRWISVDNAKRTAVIALRQAGYRWVGETAETVNPCTNGTCDCGDVDPDDRITLPDGVEASAYRYLRKPAADAIEAELARGSVPLGVVDWCPGPEFRLFTTAEMTVRARELLDAIEADHTDKALWARLAALAAVVISATGREAESG